jgi:hypothetical protein
MLEHTSKSHFKQGIGEWWYAIYRIAQRAVSMDVLA